MHATLTTIQAQLNTVVSQLQSKVPNDEPFGNAHNNWTFPGLTRAELVEDAQSLLDLIEERNVEELDSATDQRLKDYVRRLQHLHSQTIPNLWGHAGQAVPAYMLTIQGLHRALSSVLAPEDHTATATKLRKMTSQVRSMEARLKDLEPRTTSLAAMVSRIENAHDAADQLPTDMASLAEAREKLEVLIQDATKDHGHIEELRGKADGLDERLRHELAP